jgi:hypothetical protein
MATRSGQSYGGNCLSQQQRDDLLLEIAHQMGSLSKRVDTIWSQVFDTPECSGEKTRGKALKTINSKALKKTQKRSKFLLDSPRQAISHKINITHVFSNTTTRCSIILRRLKFPSICSPNIGTILGIGLTMLLKG